MSTRMGKYCYAVIHADGHVWYWGDDAISLKRVSVEGLPDAVKIKRTNGSTNTISLGPTSKYFSVPNMQREKAGLSIGEWVARCEAHYRTFNYAERLY
jgi:hypothetical protein